MSARVRVLRRIGLGYLAMTEVVVGLWQLLAPRSFYDDFPLPGHPWVAMLPGYNEHLLRDLGGLNLGMGVVLAVAAVRLDAVLRRTAVAGYLLYALPHLVFHLGHLHGFATVDVIGQVVTLILQVVVALAVLW
jgi:hypothetical protein